jgi:hypothetical protein
MRNPFKRYGRPEYPTGSTPSSNKLIIVAAAFWWKLKYNKFQPPAKVIFGFLLNDAFSYYSCSQVIWL